MTNNERRQQEADARQQEANERGRHHDQQIHDQREEMEGRRGEQLRQRPGDATRGQQPEPEPGSTLSTLSTAPVLKQA